LKSRENLITKQNAFFRQLEERRKKKKKKKAAKRWEVLAVSQ
jgi:hypothetical protein